MVYDARGHFHEPHTGRRVDLGTLGVRGYVAGWATAWAPPGVAAAVPAGPHTAGPADRFRFALFLEKEGFHPHLQRARVQERFDLALMSTKGMSNIGSRKLVDDLSAAGVTVLVLHDFDKTGLLIVRWLRSDGKRYQFARPPRVIDLGLRLADARGLGLRPEPVRYEVKNDPRPGLRASGASDEEAAFLVHRQAGPKLWVGERVELNAMTSDQFVAFVERKLVENRVRKVVPDPATLAAAHARAWRLARLGEAVRSATAAVAGQTPPAAPGDLARQVDAILRDDPTLPWEAAVAALVGGGSGGRRGGRTGPAD